MSIPLYDSEPDALADLLPWVGSLIFAFAHLETIMTTTLKVMMVRLVGHEKGSFEKAFRASHAIIGSNRYSASKETINRLLRAMKAADEQQEYFKSVFSHIGEIQFLRDRLAHQYTYQGTPQYNGIWINSDFASVREVGNENPIIFQTKAVAAATYDINTAKECFDGIFDHHVVGRDRRISYDLSPPSWQYKPALLVRGNRSVQALLQGTKNPPPSWSD